MTEIEKLRRAFLKLWGPACHEDRKRFRDALDALLVKQGEASFRSGQACERSKRDDLY